MADTRIPFSNGNTNNTLSSNSTLVFDNVTGSVGIGGATVAGASLNLASPSQGFLPNRGTTAQRNLITPVTGMIYFDTTLNLLLNYNGSEWVESSLDVSYLATTIAWGGIFSTPITGNVEYWRFGNMGVAYFHDTLAPANVGSTFLVTTTSVPVEYSPVIGGGVNTLIQADDNGLPLQGYAVLAGAGGAVCTVGVNKVSGVNIAFTNSWSGLSNIGSSGFRGFSLVYSVA